MTDSAAAAAAPLVQEGVSGLELPLGRRIELPGRGTTFVRLVDGPSRSAPTVLLLHGWVASGGLNWYQAFGPLSEHFNIVAPDLRGHGRGIRDRRRFRLSDCADDCAALLDELGTGPVIACGYSMGGPVAQLLWHRHRDHVAGLVLGATSATFIPGLQQRMMFVGMMALAAGGTRTGQMMTRLPGGRRVPVMRGVQGKRPESMRRWAPAEMRRHDVRMVFEAGNAIATFSSRRWIGDVDVPTTVLVTTKDRAVDPSQQMRLVLRIPGAQLHRYDQGHTAPVLESFGTAVTEACLTVADRLPQTKTKRLRTV
jgi:pimeloyl-ACP methyl ester carboxylesterase